MYYLLKYIIKHYNVIVNGKNFIEQLIDSDIKRYTEIGKLTTGKGEYYTPWCLLNYEYIKNHYKLISFDMSRQKELDADLKAIEEIILTGQLKNHDGVNPDGTQSIFVLTILEKNQRNVTKTFLRKHNSIIRDGKLWRINS